MKFELPLCVWKALTLTGQAHLLLLPVGDETNLLQLFLIGMQREIPAFVGLLLVKVQTR